MSPIKKTLSAAMVIAFACGALAVCGPATAIAKAPHGTLTRTEYKLLSKTLAGMKKALFGKGLDLTLGYSSCRADGSSSPLMRSERGECGHEVALFEQLEQVEVTDIRCQAQYPTTTATTTTATTTTGTTTATTTTGTTTTETTTTGTTTAPASVDGFTTNRLLAAACMSPDYARVARDIGAMYTSAALNHVRATERGFTGTCLAVLAGPSNLIADERRLAAATKQVASDFATLTQLAHGQSPSHVPTNSQLTSDALAFELTATSYIGDATPNVEIAACPHDS